jgi:hypothetical protein
MTFIPDQFGPNKWNRLFGFKLGEEARTKIRGLVYDFHEDKRVTNEDAANEDAANEDAANEDTANEDTSNEDMDDEWGDDEDTANKDIANKDIANKDMSKLGKSINRFLSIIEKSVSDYHFMTKGGGIDFNEIDKTKTYKYLKNLNNSIDKLALLISKLDNEHSELNKYIVRGWCEKRFASSSNEGGQELYPPNIIQKQLPGLKRVLKGIHKEVSKRGGDNELETVRPKGGRPSNTPFDLGIPVYKYYMETLRPHAIQQDYRDIPVTDATRTKGLSKIFSVIFKDAKIDTGHDMFSFVQKLEVIIKG